jgi:hypothetical protein
MVAAAGDTSNIVSQRIVAFYRSRADFVGVDVLTLEVTFPGGKTEVQRFSITVGSGTL